jgi:hypothetical protein
VVSTCSGFNAVPGQGFSIFGSCHSENQRRGRVWLARRVDLKMISEN